MEGLLRGRDVSAMDRCGRGSLIVEGGGAMNGCVTCAAARIGIPALLMRTRLLLQLVLPFKRIMKAEK